MDNSYCLPYSETAAFSKLFLDYVDAAPHLKEFYKYAVNIDSIAEAIENKKKEQIDRALLVNRLEHQYQSISPSEQVKRNIDLLKNENTFTITTGHQLAIYTGEWYFIFKILTAIKLAEEAKTKFPEYNFVPIFWMASEDHDFEEINHIYLKNQKFEWKLDAKGPAGRLSTEGMQALTKSLKLFFADRPHSEELIKKYEDAYTGNTLADATRILVNDLFAEYGLVIIDADDIEFKKSWKDIIRRELFESKSLEACNLQTEKLEALNYSSQIFPREINLFYLMDGYRERIIKEQEQYKTNDGYFLFDKIALENEIENHPERFSPNVVLRPVYQESILPNLCYIGGPGEIAYWLQLKEVFNTYKVSYPILAWRNSFLIAEEKDKERWNEFGFELKDLFKDLLTLENEYVLQHQSKKIKLDKEVELLHEFIETIKIQAMSVDENLKFSLQGTEKRILRMMERIEHKIWKAEKRKFKEVLEKIGSIKEKYFPSGKLQERRENFSFWYAENGKEGLKELYKSTDVLKNEFKILFF